MLQFQLRRSTAAVYLAAAAAAAQAVTRQSDNVNSSAFKAGYRLDNNFRDMRTTVGQLFFVL